MSEFDKGDIVVCGAGLVGALVGYVLQKRGFNVSIYERYGDIRQIPSLGRSINLVLTGRGLRAIDAIGGGLRGEVLALGVPVTGRVMHQMDSSTQYQPYGKDDKECNYSISRCAEWQYSSAVVQCNGVVMCLLCTMHVKVGLLIFYCIMSPSLLMICEKV